MEKIALLFPGQGSQYVGMSQTLYKQYEIARQTFEEANDILGYDLTKLCMEGTLFQLSRIEHALPALLTASVTAFRVYMQEVGITPQFLAGHSLGEYSALTCAGAIKFPDALRLVQKRAQLAKEIADSNIGGMTIISNVDVSKMENACRKISAEGQPVIVSCYNSSNEVAVSGYLNSVQLVEDEAVDSGAQIAPLMGTAPFHSGLMSPAAEALQAELQKYSYGHIKWPVIANATASIYEGADKIVERLTQQIMLPVRWQETMRYLERQGVTMTIELGAKNVLSNLIKLDTGIRTMCFDHKEDRQELIEELAVRDEYRKHKPTVISKCLAAAVATPNLNFDEAAYRRDVVDPYRSIQSIQDELEQTGEAPSVEQMRRALSLLQGIFAAKGVSEAEQRDWFYQIFDETGTHYLFPEHAGQQLETLT